jgi:hypothetical protein
MMTTVKTAISRLNDRSVIASYQLSEMKTAVVQFTCHRFVAVIKRILRFEENLKV